MENDELTTPSLNQFYDIKSEAEPMEEFYEYEDHREDRPLWEDPLKMNENPVYKNLSRQEKTEVQNQFIG